MRPFKSVAYVPVIWVTLIFLLLLQIPNADAYQFLGTCSGSPLKWDRPAITMLINRFSFPDTSPVKPFLLQAMSRWGEVRGSYIGFDPLMYDGGYRHGNFRNEIVWGDITDPNILAYTQLQSNCNVFFKGWTEADIVFNANLAWRTGFDFTRIGSPFNFEGTALHELGHALGLDHESSNFALMAPFYPNLGPLGDGKLWFPHADDRQGARALYPDGTSELEVATSMFKVSGTGDTRPNTITPTVVNAGQTVTVEYTAANLSTVAFNFNVAFYLSTDNVITAGDTFLDWSTLMTGGPGTWTIPRQVTIPITTPPGTYYLGYIVDYDNRLLETYENNNAQAIATPITVNPGQFRLFITRAGIGSGMVTSIPQGINCPNTCDYLFNYGSVTLTATPNPGSFFTGWSGDPDCLDGAVTMNAQKSCTANFSMNQTFNLTLARSGTGAGTVTSNPAGINCGADCRDTYNNGTVVALTATAGANSVYAGWSGEPDCSDGIVTMNADKTCYVTFNYSNPREAVFFNDDFNRATGLGSNWRVYYGPINTDGSYAVSAQSSGAVWAGITPSLSTNDYGVESTLIVPAGSAYSGIIVRGDPTDISRQGYAAQISTSGVVRLYRRSPGGVWTLLRSASPSGGIAAGQPYQLQLEVSGSTPVNLKVYFQGNLLFTYDDTASNRVLSGIPGFQNYNAGVKYDFFTVTRVGGSSADTAPPNPPADSLLFEDQFNRTSDMGPDWVVQYSSFITDGAYAISTYTTGASWAGIIPALGTDNYAVESVLIVPPGVNYSGIIARGNSMDLSISGYAAQIGLSDGTVRLYRRSAGSWVELQRLPAPGGLTAGTPYKLKLAVTGSDPAVNLEVYFQDSLLFTYSDSAPERILSGIPGIENYSSDVKYDSFRVMGLN